MSDGNAFRFATLARSRRSTPHLGCHKSTTSGFETLASWYIKYLAIAVLRARSIFARFKSIQLTIKLGNTRTSCPVTGLGVTARYASQRPNGLSRLSFLDLIRLTYDSHAVPMLLFSFHIMPHALLILFISVQCMAMSSFSSLPFCHRHAVALCSASFPYHGRA